MKKYFLIYLIIIIFLRFINGDKIDPKLDFQESKEDSKNNKTLDVSQNTSITKTSSPKIQGVRVTVDTGNLKKSKEFDSNESIEIVDNKNTRKIGIHTDITFEITDDNKGSKNLTIDSDIDDTDASVPVFKGRIPTSTKKPTRKPYDPRTQQWLPPSSTVPSYQSPPFSSTDDDRFYPRYNPSRIPIFTRTRDNDDTDIYRSIDSWSNFVPITSVWTTERTYRPVNYDTNYYQTYRHYDKDSNYNYQIPSSALSLVYQQQNDDGPQWKPCYCLSEIRKNWKNKRYDVHSSSIIKVNSRLENPFLDRRKRRK